MSHQRIASDRPAPALPVSARDGRDDLVVMAAGSLRRAMGDIAAAFERAGPAPRVRLVFGTSGLLLERIRYGERADVFASANLEHPQALVADGDARGMRPFARNELCALVAPGVTVDSGTLIERLLDADVKVGTSTPKADPSGDYALALFERIERLGRAGAFRALSAKALQLTGGPNSPLPPAERNVYAAFLAEGRADIFLTYCTNASQALAEQPQLRLVTLPPAIQVSARYGVAVMRDAPAAADAFADFMLGGPGQQLLAQQGFLAP